MITIIDYGAGNLRSVANALRSLGCLPTVSKQPNEVLNASAVIFPGVGAAGDTIRSLRESGMDDAIREVIGRGKPFFAICVGMQVLLSATEENGLHKCLGIIPGAVKRLHDGLKVPHMGWNQVKQRVSHPIFEGIHNDANFYFVHSYHCIPEDAGIIAGTTEYGISICSVIIRDNVIAVQFHPEKSGELGLRMYTNFLNIAGMKR